VVVRVRNEAGSIGAALTSLHGQTVPLEIIVVDSGSMDSTLEVARPFCDELVQIRPETFTFGRALNIGAERASGEVVFALSAHCVAADPMWAERSLEHYQDASVAGTAGLPYGPGGASFDGPRKITFDDVRRDPRWGYSNHAGSWRRTVWEEYPFDEKMTYCEDKQWMWRIMLASWTVVADARLVVDSSHRRAAGFKALWVREYNEGAAVAEHLDYPVPALPSAAVDWWSSFPGPSARPRWQRRLSPWRMTEIVAGIAGQGAGARRRGQATIRLPEVAERV
jgi:glycosyltransferase involved in cell wall biosynthesis